MSLPAIITVVASCVGAFAVGWLVSAVVRALARRRPFLATADQRCRWPMMATLVTSAGLSSMPAAVHGDLGAGLRHLVLILVIASVTWLCIRVARTVEDAAFGQLNVDVSDNRRARKLRTQVSVVRRIVVAVLVIVGAAVALMTFGAMRTFGASVLASAGVAGIVGGLAAQSTLSNLFAGLQLAFTDALRMDDVVVVEDEWGRVEDLTLTYVVLHLWDERRMVLPTTYFTTQPFQNWTRSSARILGTVLIYLDYSAPIEAVRAEAERIITRSPRWDGQSWALQVTDATEHTIEVRVLASAGDASTAFDLRCEIREQLLAWISAEHPDALPTNRIAAPDGPDAPFVAADARELVGSQR